MNNFFRGMLAGIGALIAGFVVIVIALSIASAILNSQTSGHMVISLHYTSPLGVALLAFLALLFFGGFSYGARHHSAQTH